MKRSLFAASRPLCFVVLLFFVGVLGHSLLLSTCFADGLIVISEPRRIPPIPHPPHYPPPHPRPPSPYALAVEYHHVKVTINNRIATTEVSQAFRNPTRFRLEGYYLFPIPKGAVIREFSMTINGRRTDAELLPAGKARRLYEDIVRKIRDPALLEYVGQDLYKVRIFPIEPMSTKKVWLSYKQVLDEQFDSLQYLYPLNTEKFSATPLRDVSIDVNVSSDKKIAGIYCPTHEVEIVRRNGHHARLSFEAKETRPDRDFKLIISTKPEPIGFSFLTHRVSGEAGYFFLSIAAPEEIDAGTINRKAVTFVLDCSGSMAGEKLEQAKKALIYCVENLHSGDTFEIIRFSTEAEALFGSLKPAERPWRVKAREFIESLRPIGGTNIEEALSVALKKGNAHDYPHFIVFITDGKPTIGETNEDRLISEVKKAGGEQRRIFTFGIGTDLNTHLLDKLTELSGASRTYIDTGQDVEVKISQFFDRVQSPVMTNISLQSAGQVRLTKLQPRKIPPLFKGSVLTIFGRFDSEGSTTLRLSGSINQRQREFTYRVTFPEENRENDFIASLWATRRIGFLLDEIRLHGESKELVDEITDLARQFGIVTPYTSYLILEDESDRLTRRDIPHDLSIRQSFDGLYGEKKSEVRSAYRAMRMKDSKKGVQASIDVQNLNQAVTVPQSKSVFSGQEEAEMQKVNESFAQNVQIVVGQAFYRNGKFWIDGRLQQKKTRRQIRIPFASDKYFALMDKEPEIAQFFSLGKNIRFYYKGIQYEVYE